MKKRIFTLKEYSCFAAVFLITNSESDAEVVYTDLEPDTIIENDLEYAIIDMDNNGTIDVGFRNRSFDFLTWTYGSGSTISHWEAIYVGPEVSGNKIAANSFSTGFYGFTGHLPYALGSGILINADMSFWNSVYLEMAFRIVTPDGNIGPRGGYWYPEVLDHYLGVYFKDDTDCYHYGWIRCSVEDSGRVLIIKDYAYETECDYPILAGDTVHYLGVNEIENNLNANIYSFNKIIYINLPEINDKTEIHIYDLNGKEIYFSIMTDCFTALAMTSPAGIYLVEIISGKEKYSKKIYLN